MIINGVVISNDKNKKIIEMRLKNINRIRIIKC